MIRRILKALWREICLLDRDMPYLFWFVMPILMALVFFARHLADKS